MNWSTDGFRRLGLVCVTFSMLVIGCGDGGKEEDPIEVGEDGTKQKAGQCIDASSCPVSCSQDTDCRTDEGEVCCDYKEFGSACVPSERCPTFCSSTDECDTSEGEQCCRTRVSSEQKVCTQAEECLNSCEDNRDCTTEGRGPDEVCCEALENPICVPEGGCPKSCESSKDCDQQVCCKNIDQLEASSAIKSSVEGVCRDSCPQPCESSDDCRGQLCCEGICADSCPNKCDSGDECDKHEGEVCCESETNSSPWWDYRETSSDDDQRCPDGYLYAGGECRRRCTRDRDCGPEEDCIRVNDQGDRVCVRR